VVSVPSQHTGPSHVSRQQPPARLLCVCCILLSGADPVLFGFCNMFELWHSHKPKFRLFSTFGGKGSAAKP
jgi:hypothetical protein